MGGTCPFTHSGPYDFDRDSWKQDNRAYSYDSQIIEEAGSVAGF